MVIRNIKFILLFCIAVTLLIFCVACSQEGKAQRNFVSIIEKEFEALKAEEVERKEQPKCQLINAGDPFGSGLPALPSLLGMEDTKEGKYEYLANYREYIKYTYDIKKTDSVVTPFLGRVSFIFNSFDKRGSTMQECIDSEWELFPIRKGKELEKAKEQLELLEIKREVTAEAIKKALEETRAEYARLKRAPLAVGKGKEYGFSQEYAYQDGEWVLKATHDLKIKPVKE